jgi:TolB protein
MAEGENEFGGIFFTDLATGKEKYLTEGSIISQYERFSWSPVARQLVYTERGDDKYNTSLLELYLLDLNSNKTRLTNNNFDDSNGIWSPDGQTIAFWASAPDLDEWFYLMDADGTNIRPFFEDDPEIEYAFLTTAWSPDSQKLAISTTHFDTEPIDVNNLQYSFQIAAVDTREIVTQLPDDRVRIDFSWSPDSDKLVYLSDPIKLNEFQLIYTTMYVLDISTQEETRLASFEVLETPIWSPVDDLIAFSASDGDDELNLYLMKSDGTGLKKLTEEGFYRVSSWSPDGKKLAVTFLGEELNEHEIFVFDIASKAFEQVTDNKVFDSSPIWVEL